MKINMNDKVRVRLTKAGAGAINKALDDLYDGLPAAALSGRRRYSEGQELHEQLWYIIATLTEGGYRFYLGGPEAFVDNTIEIDDPPQWGKTQ